MQRKRGITHQNRASLRLGVFYRYGVAGIARFVERRVARHCLVMRRVIVVAVPGDGNDREGHGSAAAQSAARANRILAGPLWGSPAG
jgi:hypothetical protein